MPVYRTSLRSILGASLLGIFVACGSSEGDGSSSSVVAGGGLGSSEGTVSNSGGAVAGSGGAAAGSGDTVAGSGGAVTVPAGSGGAAPEMGGGLAGASSALTGSGDRVSASGDSAAAGGASSGGVSGGAGGMVSGTSGGQAPKGVPPIGGASASSAGGTGGREDRPLLPLPMPVETRMQNDVEYGTADGVKLLLDVSVPQTDQPLPSVILVHGGGWASGDKRKDITPMFEALNGRFVWFSISYRLSGKHPWPAGKDDVQTAIRWVKAHAAEYNGDPARIGIMGYSAGGHLATLAANLPDQDARVQAAVGFAPVTDLVKDSERRGGLSPSLQKLFRVPKEITPETRQLLTEWSPISFVRPGQPPVMLICGDKDTTVPLQMCQDYQATLQTHGVPGELVVVPGGQHRITAWKKAAFEDQLIDWLWQALR